MGASPEGKSEDGWGDMAAKLAEDVQKYLQSASMETSTLVVVLLVTVACGILAGIYTLMKQRRKEEAGPETNKKLGEEKAAKLGESIVGSNAWPTAETENKDTPGQEPVTRDPVEFCGHIPSEVKKTQQRIAMKKLEQEMTAEQKAREREVQRQQLESIFKLMEQQQDKFGVNSMDQIEDQMSLYVQT